jgi:hypothetical protein
MEADHEAESELECFVQALESVIEIKSEQQKAYNEYEGSSPGWALSSIDDRVRDAVSELGNHLGRVIDRRVKSILLKKGIIIPDEETT